MGWLEKAFDNTVDPLRKPYGMFWRLILGMIAITFVGWLFNISGGQGVNIFLAIVGLIPIFYISFRPSFLVGAMGVNAILDFLRDKDVSQGAVAGLSLLKKLVLGVAFTYIVSMFTLGTWSFAESPGSFWVIYAGVLVIFITSELFQLGTSLTPRLVIGYAITCIIIAGWNTLGDSYVGRSFDPQTGEPMFMVDPRTGANDALGRKPAECRPRRVPHQGFNYAEQGTCFSSESGLRLVPLDSDNAVGRNPMSLIRDTWGRVSSLELRWPNTTGGSCPSITISAREHNQPEVVELVGRCPVRVQDSTTASYIMQVFVEGAEGDRVERQTFELLSCQITWGNTGTVEGRTMELKIMNHVLDQGTTRVWLRPTLKTGSGVQQMECARF